jgi:competence protein ComEA
MTRAPIPLNRASAAELETLPGIGPVLARRIVAHREQFGPFRSTDELRAVRGVGPRLLARLRGLLYAGP